MKETADSKKGTPVRRGAIQQLNRIEDEGAYISRVRGLLEADDPDGRHERQAMEYVAGITRWRRWLDFLLASFYKGDLSSMELMLKQILRLGAYDLLYLQTPPHAALNEAVELTKALVRPKAAGLTNGILRALLRHQDDLPQPDTKDEVRNLAIRWSHPTWMVRRWVKRYGVDEAVALMQWNNQRPVYGLRINPLKTTRIDTEHFFEASDIDWEPSPLLDDFVRLSSLQPVIRAGWLREGKCVVQDEAAGLVVRLLNLQRDETVIDLCAAPGGKACYAATAVGREGEVYAFDIHEGRVALICKTALRLGLENVHCEARDMSSLVSAAKWPRGDKVLLDVPCSGLGVLSKRADLRWNRTAEAIPQLVTLQDSLLDVGATLVKPGGLLVYSTCTLEPEENEARVWAFLKRNPEFILEPAHSYVPDDLVTADGFYATLPHRHHIDGAFGARLRHRGA